MKRTALLILPLALLATHTRAAQPNMIRNGDFEDEALDGWQPGENVLIEVTTQKVHSGNRAIKLAWHGVTEMAWGRGGNLCSVQDIITQNLKEDTRYRVKCSVLVDEFHVADESRKWLAQEPAGKYDAPTVTIGCFGGYWTSRMPWVAYDIGKLGTWQEMEFEFTTPFNTVRSRGESGAECFRLHFDVYPNQTGSMRSSGVLYVDSLSLKECPTRVGFTKTKTPIRIDGDLGDWWETNPAVITCDQASDGRRAPNRSASGIFYTAWDEERLYVAAKVIDDDVAVGKDGIAVWVNGREWFISSGSAPQGCDASMKPVERLGSTANMYRIVTQFGEEVRGRAGYVVEAAISREALGNGGPISERTSLDVALEIRDVDRQGGTRHLYFPNNETSGRPAQTAAAVFANEKGETRGGEYPQYAVTDAGNPRKPGGGPDLTVKNVTAQVVRGGRLGYTVAPYRRGDSDKVDAIVSWTTNWPASGSVRYGLDTGYGSEVLAADGIGGGTSIALRAVLRDLERTASITSRSSPGASMARRRPARTSFSTRPRGRSRASSTARFL